MGISLPSADQDVLARDDDGRLPAEGPRREDAEGDDPQEDPNRPARSCPVPRAVGRAPSVSGHVTPRNLGNVPNRCRVKDALDVLSGPETRLLAVRHGRTLGRPVAVESPGFTLVPGGTATWMLPVASPPVPYGLEHYRQPTGLHATSTASSDPVPAYPLTTWPTAIAGDRRREHDSRSAPMDQRKGGGRGSNETSTMNSRPNERDQSRTATGSVPPQPQHLRNRILRSLVG